jgi:transcriptional regulator with XRE-family HTH domain
MHPIIRQLKARRKALGMSLDKLSEKSGIARTGLLYYEKGIVAPSFLKLIDWAQAVGFDFKLICKFTLASQHSSDRHSHFVPKLHDPASEIQRRGYTCLKSQSIAPHSP